ncbi:MAG: 3-phosphoshikimate 1-carboxyvinyltransferase [Bacteroidetes bacterium GWE2_41_25]|nr:MAG: 3-phosphoshikimate 1-carboxyvinyltransferase [Bacteroidetes bacterium GWA2_40_15]OFX91020.1 MAG: 3-phosphoshikimate 1-carboxyvinyltransferase [Bacteroidetes bacterium GWC2_40_22]OFY13386.1 MAG: 3-phosphoshikimate 1-carboxyvinyltransferase [Bacteroidetes bacterium GWE2_41_25]OFY61973.1 MAG: 3-phosphoshikimate 1-carboxyvinyltransferase [Bacteroidetes bacterium GWF2_41_9]HBH84912.1 3-phosphoshikimate 1-carboxyvinyltransferase [Bacteroidales bacterium]
MERYIDPSPLKGTVKAPSSKSMTQRAIAAALLADGQSTIHNPSYCDDSLAAMSIAVGLGARIEPHSDKMIVDGTGNLRESKLNCGESGLAIRMFSPIAALFPEKIILTGANSLRKRPMKMIEEALNQMGVSCTSSGGFLPLTIKGPIKGGRCEIDGSVSSQLLTGLLMALPLAQEDSEIKVNDLKSKPYIEMTIQILKSFGVTIHNENFSLFRIPGNQKYIPYDYTVEGDWSGGAFLLVAGAINGELTITGLQKASRQSDMTILDALRDAGAKMKISDDSVWISHSPLKAFSFDATHSPDLFPPLTVLAAYCDGVSTIKGVTRLIHKESNRAEALRLEFGKLKIMIDIDGDIMSITGGKPEGAKVESHDDHRITMAMAVAALKASGRVYIRDSQCVGKSYPGFFDDLRTLGATVHE